MNHTGSDISTGSTSSLTGIASVFNLTAATVKHFDVGSTTDYFQNSTAEGESKLEITKQIDLYVPPFVIVIGVIVNILIIVVMRSRFFRSLSTSVYMIAAAINDVLSLLVAVSAHWLYVNFPWIFIRNEHSDDMCKFFNFYGWGNTDLGILITAAMTTERAIAIVFPLLAASKCTIKRARITVVILVFIIVAKEFHFLFSSDMVPPNRTERLCDVFPPTPTYEYFWLNIWPWIDLGFYSLSFLLIVVNNSILIHFVRRSTAEKHLGRHKMRHIVPILIGESISTLLMTFPFSIYLTILSLMLQFGTNVYEDPSKQSQLGLAFSITFYLKYSNKCVNILVYCLAGSRFRQGLVHVCCYCCGKKKRIMSYTSTMNAVTRKKTKTLTKNLAAIPDSGDRSVCSDMEAREHMDSSTTTLPSGSLEATSEEKTTDDDVFMTENKNEDILPVGNLETRKRLFFVSKTGSYSFKCDINSDTIYQTFTHNNGLTSDSLHIVNKKRPRIHRNAFSLPTLTLFTQKQGASEQADYNQFKRFCDGKNNNSLICYV